MVDPANASVLIPANAGPIFETIRSVVSTASYVVGGIFGIYLILLLVRWWQNRIVIRLLKDIKFNLEQQNKKQKLPHSKDMFHSKVYKKFAGIFEKEK